MRNPDPRTDVRSASSTGTRNSAPADAAHDLGIEWIDRSGGEHHPIDAGRLGRPQDRPQVAGVGDAVGDEDETGRPEVERRWRDANDGEDGLGRVGRRNTFDDAGREHERSGPGDGSRASRDELGLDLPPGISRFADELAALDDERTVVGT